MIYNKAVCKNAQLRLDYLIKTQRIRPRGNTGLSYGARDHFGMGPTTLALTLPRCLRRFPYLHVRMLAK